PKPPKNLPPKRVLWPPMPKMVALVAFQPRFSRNGTGGFAQVLVTARYMSPLVYDLSVPVNVLLAAPETKWSLVRTTPPIAMPGIHGPNCPSLKTTTLP